MLYQVRVIRLYNHEDNQEFGIYQVTNKDGAVVYIGSTTLSLEKLEHNHRNWIQKGYKKTTFREALTKYPDNYKFSWAIPPRVTSRPMIELEESALIRYCHPLYNSTSEWGQFPWKASITNGRYPNRLIIE